MQRRREWGTGTQVLRATFETDDLGVGMRYPRNWRKMSYSRADNITEYSVGFCIGESCRRGAEHCPNLIQMNFPASPIPVGIIM